MALGRLSILKSGILLKIDTAPYDTQLRFELTSATDKANGFCDRKLEETTYQDEYYTPFTENKLYLRNYPVSSVTTVKFWDSATSAFVTEAATLYELINGRFIQYPKRGQASNSTYNTLPLNESESMKVTYTAGYSTSGWEAKTITDAFGVPANLEWATCAVASIDWALGRQDRDLMGIVTRSLGAESASYESFETGVYPDKVMAVFDQYKRLVKI